MDGISRSRGWDKEILYGVLPMEQLVLSNKWAIFYPVNLQHSSSMHIFSIRVENSVDPDQMASSEAS